MQDRQKQILKFLQEIEQYKTIERQCFTSNPNRRESDAEHSWHVAMFVLLFARDLDASLSIEKMLKLALMHDLVEIYAGDTFAFDNVARETKKIREQEASLKLFAQLPEDFSYEFQSLFDEYESGSSGEAKIVKSFDKIQAILQNLCSEGKAWKEHNITLAQMDQYKRPHMKHDPLIMAIYQTLFDEARESGFISE